ncbi:probable protein phosphatase 2C 80 [Selaginella moellendorffii]|uniref:probable protein phosphatase 2C 80 n=1 Tax=Selaginella moellendorffii TaxID=88036 RepID=UPI000D1C455E|nr:probable protein phosphatase 2C 80 [Selaginella moellendorffii]|eukprot:XP_024515370.1 probable protein phosphatase 2C 80 [Selaginella moellendorffii]
MYICILANQSPRTSTFRFKLEFLVTIRRLQRYSCNFANFPFTGKGDIIALGTDGLFDNLFNDDITEVLKNSLGSDQVNLKAAAADRVAGAQAERLDSPFARAAAKARMNWSGGKLDDTTAVVAFVT